ncbi:hypothetical protein [Corynebacterium sp. UMB2355A]|uniref:hypothetical protein n=1 Tax=Corynebacterium sp. UMB2355A TaxID=3081222 RepID=UPI0029FF1E0E|nr:hypothetical protein [Corynebacterium sp. UMB2355A]WPJ93310.1 hypothetical protein R0V12_02820 [Corynebacterium sp. UMB2355A]
MEIESLIQFQYGVFSHYGEVEIELAPGNGDIGIRNCGFSEFRERAVHSADFSASTGGLPV